jgi:hypothetical protein
MTYGLENRCSIQLSYGCVFPSWSAKDRVSVQYQQIYFKIFWQNVRLTVLDQYFVAKVQQDVGGNHLKDKLVSSLS